MNLKNMHPADQLVLMMNRLYYGGYTTTSGGNLSVKDDEGNIWITPGGYDKGSLKREDIVKVTPDGQKIGKHNPSIEFPFHTLVMKVTGAKAVMHAHPPALVAVSLLRIQPEIDSLPVFSKYVKRLSRCEYDLPGSIKLGEKLAEVFAQGYDAVMMDNHGIAVCAENLLEAFWKFEAMEVAARIALAAASFSSFQALSAGEIERFNALRSVAAEGDIPADTPDECDIRSQIVGFSKRCVWHGFFNSFQGNFAVRTADGFIAMPDRTDREYLKECDLVKIKNGLCERGKTPSVYSDIFAEIFKKQPDVNGVSVSTPVNAMAFAVSGEELDSKTIPESYIMMRTVARVSFADYVNNPLIIADIISLDTPVVLVENGALFTAGATLTKCFDSLEVADFTAKTILNGKTLHKKGEIKKITAAQVEEINEAFHL